jgi:hypothetical protein
MNAIYRSFWHHVTLLCLLAAAVVAMGAALWVVAETLGIDKPLPWFIAGVGAVMVWSMSRDHPGPPTSSAPELLRPAASRSLSKTEVEALILLQREGVITAAELRSALGGLIPPPAPREPAGRSGRGR